MSAYVPPEAQGLPFNFTESGYSPPDFSAVPFDFFTGFSDSAFLTSAVQVMQMYTETTYSEIKECKTIIIGYGANGIQTLQLPCEYLGIRDLLSSIYGELPYFDLTSLIVGQLGFISEDRYLSSIIKSIVKETVDLQKIIHGWDLSDLQSLLDGYALFDLSFYIKTQRSENKDILSAIRVLMSSYADISYWIGGFKGYQIPYDLYSDIYAIPPSDLISYLNIIEISDLPVDISPQKYKGYSTFESFLRTYHKENNNLISILHGWDLSYLPGYLLCAHIHDLPGTIQGSFTESIFSFLYPVVPAGILSNIHGFATVDLPSELIGGYGRTHLLGYIYGIPPSDISSYIGVFKEVEAYSTISSYLESYHQHDLWSTIHYIEPDDLTSTIVARGGYKNLDVIIYPKVIFVRQSVFVNIVSSRILNSVINSHCFASAYSDLSHSLYAFDKLDLRAIIHPRLEDDDNQKDLTSYINYGYLAEDTFSINIFMADRYAKIPIDINRISTMYTEDTISITFSSDFSNFKDKVNSFKNLSSYLYGLPVHADLASRIVPSRDYTFEGINSESKYKNHLVAINLQKSYEVWTRELDIYFRSVVNQYYYAQAGEAVYRVDRDEHVIVYVEGYSTLSNPILGIDRGNVRGKYVFNLSNYTTIDAAIRDAIDRVSVLRSSDLPVYINSVEGVGNYSYLSSYVLPIYSIRSVKSIISTLVGISETMTDLPSTINGEYPKIDLGGVIVGVYYDAVDPLLADFIFTEEDLTSVGGSQVNFTFKIV